MVYLKGSGKHKRVDPGWNVGGNVGSIIKKRPSPANGIKLDPIKRYMEKMAGAQTGNPDSQMQDRQREQDMMSKEDLASRLQSGLRNKIDSGNFVTQPGFLGSDRNVYNGDGSIYQRAPLKKDDGKIQPHLQFFGDDKSYAGANKYRHGVNILGEKLSDMNDVFKSSGDPIKDILARFRAGTAGQTIKGKRPLGKQIPKELQNAEMSETMRRYLLNMFNGGF